MGSFKSLNFEFAFLIGVIVRVYCLNFFSLLSHLKISATWGGGPGPPHQSRTAYIFKKKFEPEPKGVYPRTLSLILSYFRIFYSLLAYKRVLWGVVRAGFARVFGLFAGFAGFFFREGWQESQDYL